MSEKRQYLRFSLAYRIEHWVLAGVFTILAVTGLVQMFASAGISKWIVGALGGVEIVRLTHHIAAFGLIGEALFHIAAVQYRIYVTGDKLDLMPGWQDVRIAFAAFFYNIGFSRTIPKEGRFTFAEKAEYWAVVWGTVIMAVTGFMMWNPITTTHFLPGEFVPAAKVAHGYEAILAVLAIIIWHFYYVLVKNINQSMFTGYISEEMMEYEHALELSDIKAGFTRTQIDPKKVARWRKVILPRYLVITAIFFVVLLSLTSLERTTVNAVVPAEDVNVYVPLGEAEIMRSELPGPIAGGAAPTWGNGIGALLRSKCGSCHGEPLLMGSLNLLSYATAIEGGTDKVIEAGNSENSLIIRKVRGGGHPGVLTRVQLEAVIRWIDDGALEGAYEPGLENWIQPGTEAAETLSTAGTEPGVEAPEGTTEGANYTWDNRVASIFRSECGSCHNSTSKTAGLDLTTYDGALTVLSRGSPDGSKLIRKVQGGGHLGHFSAQELEIVRAWISAGAPGVRTAPQGGEPAEPPAETQPPAPQEEQPETPQTEETPPSELTWDDNIGPILAAACLSCHSAEARTAGLDLSTYATITRTEDPVIKPGDPDASLLIEKIKDGTHLGHLSDEDFEKVRQWILNGVPENKAALEQTQGTPAETVPEEPPVPPPAPEEAPQPSGPPTWDSAIGSILQERCVMCHNAQSLMGGLDLSAFQTAISVEGVILPGDPDHSLLIEKPSTGDHPGHFTDEELALIREWISDGAPEK